jgi:uncharacterized membrane protein YedE/YeeE
MKTLFAFLSGLLFGFGLILSGMTDPAKVLAFLDIAGDWNPALMLVMGSAVLVAAPAYALARRRGKTLIGAPLHLPARRRPDARLLGGSALFGVGWGLSGICPGPGLVIAASGLPKALVFVAAMIAAGQLVRMAESRLKRPPEDIGV